MRVRTLSFFLGLSLLAGCGAQKDKPITESPIEDPKPMVFSVSDVWTVKSKTCGEDRIEVQPHEAYRLGDSLFVVVEKESESGDSLCKVGHAFNRVIQSFQYREGTSGNTYEETATLMYGEFGARRLLGPAHILVPVPRVDGHVSKRRPESLDFRRHVRRNCARRLSGI